jgi:predicted nucleic acid-binding protein
MSLHILLDSSPLGLLSNPNASTEVLAIAQWGRACVAAGHRLYIPEVIDYELRRELLRAGKTKGVAKLDSLKITFRYLPITTAAMIRAADLWAMARRTGVPTGDPKKLDIDVILSAQALTLSVSASDIIVATSNAGHISRFVAADQWSNIHP